MIRNILEYLEYTAKRLPDKVAFSDGTDDYTFSQVLDLSRRLGTAMAKYTEPGNPVLVLMRRHPSQLCAFFGIVYAGCHYAALDAEMPPARLQHIFSLTGARFLICDEANRKKAQECGFAGTILSYEELILEEADGEALGRIRDEQVDTDPIYIVFTSGSTGMPKGVAAAHRSVIDYAENLCKALPFAEDTVFGNQTPLYFDAPLKEILPAIKLGATVYLIPRVNFLFPVKLCRFLNEHKINTVCWVVSAFTLISSLGLLEKEKPEYLRLVAFGSEVFPKKEYEKWRRAYPGVPFYNLYGPTEATGMSCYWRADRELLSEEPIPVGRPFDNTRVLLLDDNDKPVPKTDVGREGEIYLCGTCVTLGYYNDPERTSAAFVQNPTNTKYPETVYRTGDIGRWNRFGELEFLCRRDAQIKHMGRRIELGEIETAAGTVAGVLRPVCLYEVDSRRICLFYEGTYESGDVKKALSDLLPRYMVPAVLRHVDRLPLTPNGKVDRQALLASVREHP